jgi:hypothetical protein
MKTEKHMYSQEGKEKIGQNNVVGQIREDEPQNQAKSLDNVL